MNKFLLVTSHLPEEKLFEKIYTPVDNPELAFGETRFPAIPLINAYTEHGEAIKVITISYDIPACKANAALLKKEIKTILKPKNAILDFENVVVPFDNSISAILNVYQELIKRVEDGDELYADITG